ncbi:MAG TPA: hypothetical protein VGT41_02385 [Candidatus Babeliales bacterium]|nr:hypothetical protein [Candidatus Babeliales bacterium]
MLGNKIIVMFAIVCAVSLHAAQDNGAEEVSFVATFNGKALRRFESLACVGYVVSDGTPQNRVVACMRESGECSDTLVKGLDRRAIGDSQSARRAFDALGTTYENQLAEHLARNQGRNKRVKRLEQDRKIF